MNILGNLRTVAFGALLGLEATAAAIGFDIKNEAQKFYDKREEVEITQQTADYRMKLGNTIGLGSLAALILTPVAIYSSKKNRGVYQ